jgi:hypothetical protein
MDTKLYKLDSNNYTSYMTMVILNPSLFTNLLTNRDNALCNALCFKKRNRMVQMKVIDETMEDASNIIPHKMKKVFHLLQKKQL